MRKKIRSGATIKSLHRKTSSEIMTSVLVLGISVFLSLGFSFGLVDGNFAFADSSGSSSGSSSSVSVSSSSVSGSSSSASGSSSSSPANGTASVSADVVVNLTSALSIRTLDSTASSEISSLDLELTPTPTGRFIKDTTIVDVATSNATGYTLYMASIGRDHNDSYTTDLVHHNAAINDVVGSIDSTSGNVSETNFSMSNSSYRNKWGYSLTEKDALGSYQSIPAYSTPDAINGTVSSAVEHSYTPVTIGVNVDDTIASGTYSNTLEFTAIANPLIVNYELSFNGNTTATTDQIPASVAFSTTASSASFTIPSNIPYNSTADVTFAGWSEDADDDGSDSSTLYQPGDEYTIVANIADAHVGAKTLYAIWKAADFYNIYYMQEMTANVCNTVYKPSNATGTSAKAVVLNADTTSSVSGAGATYFVDDLAGYKAIVSGAGTANVAQRSLYDIRDMKPYTVRKLADGNCWMTDDLKLNLGTYDTPITVQRARYDSNDTEDWTPTGTDSNNAAEPLNSNTKTSAPNGNYYYSWYAATAGSGTSTQTNTEAGYSICPSGWKLPANYTISTTKSYGAVANAYGLAVNGANANIFEAFPLSFARTGYYNSGSPYSVGAYGYYWSSTASSDAARAYGLVYGASYTRPQDFYGKSLGSPIRCVAL